MTVSSDRLLRRTLWGNAAFSVVSGAMLAVLAGPFARAATDAPVSVLGLDLAILFELLGVGVVAFGALCAIGWVLALTLMGIALFQRRLARRYENR